MFLERRNTEMLTLQAARRRGIAAKCRSSHCLLRPVRAASPACRRYQMNTKGPTDTRKLGRRVARVERKREALQGERCKGLARTRAYVPPLAIPLHSRQQSLHPPAPVGSAAGKARKAAVTTASAGSGRGKVGKTHNATRSGQRHEVTGQTNAWLLQEGSAPGAPGTPGAPRPFAERCRPGRGGHGGGR